MTLVLYGNVIIFKISWQTCFDSMSLLLFLTISSSNLYCGSEMFCSLVHLILIPVEMPHFAILTHASQGRMLKEINENWFITGFTSVTQKCCEACLICISNNPGKACKVAALATHPPLDRPFEHIMMDFIELTPSE